VGPFLPWNGSPWALDDGGTFEENADVCEGTRWAEGPYIYQRSFSNQAAMLGGDPCVPSIAVPYYSVSLDKEWYSTTTGEVVVPITGWSVGAVPDWVVGLDTSGQHTPTLSSANVSISCSTRVTVNGGSYCALNSGRTASLHVFLPPGAGSK